MTLQSRRYRSWRHHSLWLTHRVTLVGLKLVWLSTAVSRWRIMFRPSVGLDTFNCASCVLSPDLSADAAKTIVHAVCRLDYCNSLLHGITDSLFRRLQSVHNAAARLITVTRQRDHITPVLRDLHWLQVRRRVLAKLLVYKSLHGLAPCYLADDCILASSDKFRRRLRSADVDTCIVPTRGLPVLATGVCPLPAPGSGTACRQNCDGLILSLANSVDH